MGLGGAYDHRFSDCNLVSSKTQLNHDFTELLRFHEWRPLKVKGFWRRVKDESGNVESALVMIPLISLFLITLQLLATLNIRNVQLTTTQNQAKTQAINGQINPEDRVVELRSGDLYEKLRLLVVQKEVELPNIFPGLAQLFSGKKIISKGISVYEESESCSGGYALC